MKAVAVKELKNRLSAYLREVRAGEVLLVTDRGRVVAELRRPTVGATPATLGSPLDRLAEEGSVEPGLPQDPRAYQPSPLPRPVRSADLLEAERGAT